MLYRVVGDCWTPFINLLATKTEGEALDQLHIKRYCCRRMLLSHADLMEKLLAGERSSTPHPAKADLSLTVARESLGIVCTTSKAHIPSQTTRLSKNSGNVKRPSPSHSARELKLRLRVSRPRAESRLKEASRLKEESKEEVQRLREKRCRIEGR